MVERLPPAQWAGEGIWRKYDWTRRKQWHCKTQIEGAGQEGARQSTGESDVLYTSGSC